MILNLPFISWSGGYKEKPIEVIFDIGTLEATCDELKIEFFQIKDFINKEGFDFSVELLYQGYIRACEKRYSRPKYDNLKAIIWNEHLSKESAELFKKGMTELFGKVMKAYKNTGKKKVVTN